MESTFELSMHKQAEYRRRLKSTYEKSFASMSFQGRKYHNDYSEVTNCEALGESGKEDEVRQILPSYLDESFVQGFSHVWKGAEMSSVKFHG